MKFFYRHDWANQLSIGDEGIKGSDMDYRLEVIGVHNVADKYGFQLLKDSLAEKYTKIQDYLVEFRASEKVAVIRSHYDHCSSEECKLGDVIAKNLLDVAHKGNNLFLRNHKSLMKEYPKLASDLIMASSHNNYWRSIWG